MTIQDLAKQSGDFHELGWRLSNITHRWVKDDPDTVCLYWFVEHKSDGWYWYISQWRAMEAERKTSSEFGPFTNWMAAAADCEVAHRPEKH